VGEVPEDLLRALLKTTKRKFAGSKDIENIDEWGEPQLVKTAETVFGERPPLSLEKPFVSVLVDVWLSQLEADDPALVRLMHLAHGTQSIAKRLTGTPRSKKGRLQLVREGLGRRVVKGAVRKEFMRAHRREEKREIQSTSRELAFPVALRGEDNDSCARTTTRRPPGARWIASSPPRRTARGAPCSCCRRARAKR